MKIAYLVQQFVPEIGAGPARAFEFAQRWQSYGADVTILTAMPSRMVPGQRAGAVDPRYKRKLFLREDWSGIDVLRSWCYTSARPSFVRTMANNASFMVTSGLHGTTRLRGADVLIASSPPFLPHVAGRFIAATRRTPLVLELRDLWPDYLVDMGVIRRDSVAGRALFATERSLLKAAQAIVVVTESFKRVVVERGVDAERVTVVPNGVDLASYAPSGEPPIADFRTNEFTVGYLGNFGAGQDLSAIVRAAALLQHDGVHVTLVGDGPDRRRIEASVRSLGVQNVSIHESIPRHQTQACYHSFDVCLVPLAPVPAFAGTVPSKIFEIMACERPVLASVNGEARAIVETSGCGLAVAPGDAQAIAAGIRQLRSLSPEALRAMGARGRTYVRQHYSRDTLAQRYYECLEEVVGARKNGSRQLSAPEVAAD